MYVFTRFSESRQTNQLGPKQSALRARWINLLATPRLRKGTLHSASSLVSPKTSTANQAIVAAPIIL
jgi:hypothetical protein